MNYMSSGSCYSLSMWGDDHEFVRSEIKASQTWVCHYCGSTLDGESNKCTQCGSEKRAVVVKQSWSYANIKYIQEEDIVKATDKQPKRGFWDRFKRKGRS